MPKSTAKQRKYLEDRGITPPPSTSSCRSLISYIIEGNGTSGKNKFERAAITVRYQREWNGKRVEDTGYRRGKGKVLYLVGRKESDVMSLREKHTDGTPPIPFVAHVDWDEHKAGRSSLSYLQIINDE